MKDCDDFWRPHSSRPPQARTEPRCRFLASPQHYVAPWAFQDNDRSAFPAPAQTWPSSDQSWSSPAQSWPFPGFVDSDRSRPPNLAEASGQMCGVEKSNQALARIPNLFGPFGRDKFGRVWFARAKLGQIRVKFGRVRSVSGQIWWSSAQMWQIARILPESVEIDPNWADPRPTWAKSSEIGALLARIRPSSTALRPNMRPGFSHSFGRFDRSWPSFWSS